MVAATYWTVILAAALAAVASVVHAEQTAQSSRSAIVICSSDNGAPWKLITKGSLTRTKAGNTTTYVIEAGQHTVSWTLVINSDKSIGGTVPRSLIGAMIPPPATSRGDKFPRGPLNLADRAWLDDLPDSQSVSVDGEIRERKGSLSLVSIIGSKCPSR
jgi:hypothetical protein